MNVRTYVLMKGNLFIILNTAQFKHLKHTLNLISIRSNTLRSIMGTPGMYPTARCAMAPIPHMFGVIKRRSRNHHTRLLGHSNYKVTSLTRQTKSRRLQRTWPLDLKMQQLLQPQSSLEELQGGAVW